jgi:hypothetical protein
MGQNGVNRPQVTKFQDFIRYDFIVQKHPHLLQGPQRLRNMRIEGRTGMFFVEEAISDFITQFEDNLPLSEFGGSEHVRATWVSAFLVKQAGAVRLGPVTGRDDSEQQEGGRKTKKRNTPGDSKDTKVAKRARATRPEVVDLADDNFMVRVRGSALGGRIDHHFSGLERFADLIKWINSKGNPTGLFFRLEAVYRCTLSAAEAAVSGVDEGEDFRNGIWDQDSWNSELRNFRSVCPSARTLLIEASLEDVGEGDEPGEMVLRWDTGKAVDYERVF